jgi:hypothetical protein
VAKDSTQESDNSNTFQINKTFLDSGLGLSSSDDESEDESEDDSDDDHGDQGEGDSEDNAKSKNDFSSLI